MGPSSRITIEQCVVRSRLGTAMNPQVRLSGLTLRHNVVAGPGAFLLSGSGDGLSGVTVEWNTFFARGKSAFRVFEMPTPIGAVNTVRGNIFASTAPTSSDGIVDLRDSGGGAQGGTLFDRNVYWDYGAAGTNAITISGPDVTVVKTVGPSGTAGASYGWELDGKFANPVLTDTSYAAFNQHLRRSSAAAESLHAHVAPEAWLWATHPDSTATVDQDERNDRYVGAPAPRDTMPPATPVISSLSASTAGGVLVKTITFTMAGDDSAYGCADSLLIAEESWDGSPGITAANFRSYQIVGVKSPFCCDALTPGQGGAGCAPYVWTCRIPYLGDIPPGVDCGSDAIIPPNHVSYIMVAVKDKGGNISYSATATLDVP